MYVSNQIEVLSVPHFTSLQVDYTSWSTKNHPIFTIVSRLHGPFISFVTHYHGLRVSGIQIGAEINHV